jgi:hypothetical protein
VIPASVAAQFPPIESMPSAGVSGGWPVVAALPVVAGIPVMAALLMVMAFTAVFLVSHACKCLLLLSPSSFITTGLRGLKGAFLVAFAGTAYVSPWAGLVFSLVIIVVCVVLSGWAFRWNVFGWLFVWDFLGSRFDREVGPEEPLKGFATGNLEGVKARTYGEIRRDGETWVFSYRPWLILPRREVRWSGGRTGLRAGLLAPALTLRKDGQKDFVTIFSFRLRFYRHADVLERRLGVDERQPSRVVQGARQAFAWLSEQISGGVSQETAGRLGAKP